jgi:hypothetical protein
MYICIITQCTLCIRRNIEVLSLLSLALMPYACNPSYSGGRVAIRRITVQSQPRQIVHKTLSQKHPSQKKAGGVAQGVNPEFNPQY